MDSSPNSPTGGSSKSNLQLPNRGSVVIFGAGIAGLSAAHEAVDMGFDVTVYESQPGPGGFAKSGRTADNMPTEYSWRGFGPWYHNVYEMMRRIPSARAPQKTVFAHELSRQVLFAVVRDLPEPGVSPETPLWTTCLTRFDYLKLCVVLARTFLADRRGHEHYSRINAAQYLQNILSEKAWRAVVATFGPWIGTDSERTSLHVLGHFHLKNAYVGTQEHPADDAGEAWTHQGCDGWLLLRGPSSEVWFEPWVAHLKSKGVRFQFNSEVVSLQSQNGRIKSAKVRVQTAGHEVCADQFIVAITPFACKDVFAASSHEIQNDAQVQKFPFLVMDNAHIQISFRIGFVDKVRLPREAQGIILRDSEYNITLFPQEEVFHKDEDLGRNVKALWTGTACCSFCPGQLTGKTSAQASREQFMQEVLHQVFRSKVLDAMVCAANNGKGLKCFAIAHTEVWHAWQFQTDGTSRVSAPQPKWVNSCNSHPYMPTAQTSLANLFLAGAHCRTGADLWSMEGAAESGRRAAFLMAQSGREPIPQIFPWWARLFQAIDNILFAMGFPSVVDVALVSGLALVCWLLGAVLLGGPARQAWVPGETSAGVVLGW